MGIYLPMESETTSLIESSAREFWELAGGREAYPCDIKAAITLSLPLELHGLPGLCVSHILNWARNVAIACTIHGRDRRLHGCLLAYRGQGTIFFDTADPEDEQRFTLSHELAHFLLDYQAPRQRAITILGETILSVLDGDRLPTLDERFHAVLGSVPLGVMSHVMERPETGLPTNVVLDIEDRANRLALELLAPAASLCELLRRSTTPSGFDQRLLFLGNYLITTYGLPIAVAAPYARYLLTQIGEPTFRDWLFGNI
jgi:hypothetical protein